MSRILNGSNKEKSADRTLENILRPMWKLTYYSGVCLDWCRPISTDQNRVFYIIRCFGVTVSFFLLLFMMVFQLTQLLTVLKEASDAHSIIYNVVWFSGTPITLFTQLKFVLNRREILHFFQDWKKLETELSTFCYPGIKRLEIPKCKLHNVMYSIYAAVTAVSIIALAFEISGHPEATVLLSSYRIIRDNIPLAIVYTVHLLVVVLIWILVSVTEITPAFVYFHFSKSVDRLEHDAQQVFSLVKLSKLKSPSNSDEIERLTGRKTRMFLESKWDLDAPVRLIWVRLESLNAFVTRANHLFGSIMLFGQGGSISMMTLGTYSILYNLKNLSDPGLLINFLLYTSAISFRFISCSLISSQLQHAVNRFRNFLQDQAGRNWNHFGEDDRRLLCSFIERLQNETIAASPLGLYNINPSTLLAVFSLIVSYVIVLLQSK